SVPYMSAYEAWEAKRATAEANRKAWEGKNKALIEAGMNPEAMPEDCRIPPEPPRRTVIMNDMTIEAFMRAQARAPRGFMMFRDELAGWLGSMERYTSADAERSNWLESYDGGSYTFER